MRHMTHVMSHYDSGPSFVFVSPIFLFSYIHIMSFIHGRFAPWDRGAAGA